MRNAILFLLLLCVTAWAIPFKFAPMAVIGPTEVFPFATGGTVETYTDGDGLTWRAHSFTTVGTNELVVTRGGEMEYLIVAGGGGGGKFGGGGGAGGMLTGSVNIATGTFDAIVGAGGAGTDVTGAVGDNGQDSVFAAITAIGGGGGAGRGSGGVGVNGAAGGSGGGGSASDTSTRGMGGAGVAGQGRNGGSSNSSTGSLRWGSGGGGGAGAVGADGTGSGSSSSGGKGGDGLQSDITGELKYYAGGGGGATFSGATSGTAGTGGLGGGGAGTKVDANNGGDGAANTGGGGGGGGINATGGQGGSGIVVIRYRTELPTWESAGLNEGLVSYWAMRTNSPVVIDEFGDNDGTAINSPTFSEANGVRDDGVGLVAASSQRITLPFDGARNQTQYTVAAWVNASSLAANRVVWGESIATTFEGGTARIAFSLQTTGAVQLGGRRLDADSFTVFAVSGSSLVVTGSWHHVAGVYNGTTGSHKVYLNGVDVTSTTSGTTGTFSNTAPQQGPQIGLNVTSSGAYFQGSIDEVAVWNRALSSNEVYQIYNTPLYAPYREE